MSVMTPEPTTIRPDDNDSYQQGYTDGELAALTRLPSRRAHARAAMAHPYDPNYAAGYTDGYLDQTAQNAAVRLRALLALKPEETR